MNVDDVEILLVEDDPNDVELTLSALKENHIANKVVVVNDGEEALDFLLRRGKFQHRNADHKPKVIFLDLKLPKVSGIEVLRTVKMDDRLKVIPVVVMTSSHEEKDVVESYRLGVNSYVVKPIDFERFVRAVADVGLYWAVLNKPPI
jgi:two-component system, response regulator